MKSEVSIAAEPGADSKNGSAEAAPARTRRGKRRSTQATAPFGGASRFFLSKAESNGVPVLDREFASEPEALIESLKTGKSYFVISEWKGSADLSKKMPLVRKEAVAHKRSQSD
jgi:hypothetical protein